MIQALSNVEANLSVAQMNDDPDATKILPRPKNSQLSPRRNIRQNEIEKNQPAPKPKRKFFIQSKLFNFGLIMFLVFGIGAGVYMAFGKPWQNEEVAVPSVVGKNLLLARQILEDSRLRVNVAEVYSSTVPAGEVVKQDPDTGRNVKIERLVTIYVSKGGETIDMPDLIGLTKASAIERIQKLGLKVGSIYEKESEKDPGIVLSHDPALKTKINRGQVIDLTVSRGQTAKPKTDDKSKSEKIAVPRVENLSLDIAQSNIESSGLNVGAINYEESEQAEGTIISQNPAPDSEVSAGTSIDLIVAEPIKQVKEYPGEYGHHEDYEDTNAPSREEFGEKIQ
jgi:serine/threonine-protein kinase